MKLTLIAFVSAALAVNAARRPEAVIAARQVDTASLRSGTRSLRARQAGQSAGVGLQVNKYLNCNDIQPPFVLDDVQVVKTASLAGQDENRAICSYADLRDPSNTVSCRYETQTGQLDQAVVGACSLTINEGTSTGSCYTACRRQLTTGEFYSGSDLEVGNPVGGIINCQYANTQAAAESGVTDLLCQYDISSGGFIQGSSGNCPSALPASNFCLSTFPTV